MHITIDTNEPLTPKQKMGIAMLLDFPGTDAVQPTDAYAQQLNEGTDTSTKAAEPEKPKATRTRRTKAQIAADEAAAAAAKADAEPDLGTSANANDEGTQEHEAEEPTPASEDAESDAAQGATIEKMTEVASELVKKDRAAFKAILDKYGLPRASAVSPDKLPALIADIEAALGN